MSLPKLMVSLAEELKLGEYDLLLVGDGSGTRIGQTCGWSCSLYEKWSGVVQSYFGGASTGTNNFAELIPYIHALWTYDVNRFGGHGLPYPKVIKVAIVSDSEVTVRCGNRIYHRLANQTWWRAFEWFEEHGYSFEWRHVRRNTNTISEMSDKQSRAVRLIMEGIANA
jgi:hypothetical protein